MVKGKKWKKGESSSCNPTSHKHRDITRNNRTRFTFGGSSSDNGSLTSMALASLDAMSTKTPFVDDDAKSFVSDATTNDTFRSWASNWSDCTNATFNRVHRYWQSNSSLHKEILTVLAAVTELIKEKDGNESEVEYFAALMTGLDSVVDKENSVTAFLYLIALAIKKVPEVVLRVKYPQLMHSLMEPLRRYSETCNNVTLIKSCLMCLCWLLKCQDKSVWQTAETKSVYSIILSFISHRKPKIRKCGQEAVRMIVSSCPHMGTKTASYCLKLIAENGSIHPNYKQEGDEAAAVSDTMTPAKLNSELASAEQHNSNQNILYTLTLLKYIVHHMTEHTLKSIGECLLRLMTLKDIMITSYCFQIFHHLFLAQASQMTAELNAQIINALYDFEPSENDPQQLIAWLSVMESALKCLNRLSKPLCLSHIPRAFQAFMLTLSTSHQKDVHVMATNSACGILEQCVQTSSDEFVADIREHGAAKSLLYKLFTHIEAGLSYQYHGSWSFVMRILACAFTTFKSRETFCIVEKCLGSLSNLRESEQFTYKKEADQAIARAIRTYGPQLINECIPLQITGDETSYEYPRSWMLPLLKDNIERTEMAYFIRNLMPLANKLKAKADGFTRAKKNIEAKIFDTLQDQIWSLLPGFCNYPIDFIEAIKVLAKPLGEVLERRVDLRPIVLQSLRTLLLRNTDENREIMAKYAKNYLPIMFNIYTTETSAEKDPVRQSLADTVRCYLKVADGDLCNTFLSRAVENYKKNLATQNMQKETDANNNNNNTKVVFDFNQTKPITPLKIITDTAALNNATFAAYSLLDLIAICVPYANTINIQIVYELALSAIEGQVRDKTVQKKAYKILNAILTSGKKVETATPATSDEMGHHSNNNIHVRAFVLDRFEKIAQTFVQSLAKCNAAAKVPRLKCLVELMDYVTSSAQKAFLRQILPEVILCIKEVNYKSRDASFLLLSKMLALWQKLGLDEPTAISEVDSLSEFFHLVMLGLAGSPNMKTCTCQAIAGLAFQFREHISGPLINELFETSCMLARSEHKELVLASLNLMKILCTIFAQTTLAQHLSAIGALVHGLHVKRAGGPAPVTKSQRIKSTLKLILKKLMKKFSYEIVVDKVFESDKTTDSDDAMSSKKTKKTKSALTSVVKQGLENMLVNLKKAIEKERERKANEGKKATAKSENEVDLVSMYTTAKSVHHEVEDLLRESDSEEENQSDNKSRRTNKTSKTNKTNKSSRGDANGKSSKASGAAAMAWLAENERDDPLDLLDPLAIKRVLATQPLTRDQIAAKQSKAAQAKKTNRGFKVNADGRLMIDDDEDEDEDDRKTNVSFKAKKRGAAERKSRKQQPDELDEMMDTMSLSKRSTKSKLKRKMDEVDSDDDEDDKKSRLSYKSGGTGIHRRVKASKEAEIGTEYKSRKGRGDVKLKDRPDPYAYMPFNFSKLNKRKKAKLRGEFKGVVKAVHRGVQKATGANRRKRMRKDSHK